MKKGVLIIRVTPVRKMNLPELLSPAGSCTSGFYIRSFRNAVLWGSFLAKGLPNGYFLTTLTLAMRSCQGFYCACSAPADALLKMKISCLSGMGIVHKEDYILCIG